MAAKILHLITSLDRGGAQTMLCRLATGLDRARYEPVVVTLVAGGAMAEELRRAGIAVHTLGMRRGLPSLGAWLRFRRLLRVERPALVESWLYHADLLAALAGGHVPVLWTIRLSSIEGERRRLRLRILQAWLAALSSRPMAVLANSEAGRRFHAQLGYHPRRWEVVPNGFDVERFRPGAAARAAARRRLGIAEGQLLIGMVARVDGMKDHATFLAAAAVVAAALPEARFVLIGAGTEALAVPAALKDRLAALGECGDVAALLPALDLNVLASLGEGFPNALGEAMACAVPCISTDVGDAKDIIGDAGRIVPPRDPQALAQAMLALAALGADGLARLGARARQRVGERYALPAVIGRYEAIYASILGDAHAPKRILYLATEDWYFRSHYLPMARAAMRAGFEVTLAARLSDAAPALAAEGIRLVPLEMRRGALNPLSAIAETASLTRILRQVRPDIVHCLALKPILVGGIAACLAGAPAVVNSVTGLGFLGVGGSAKVAVARRLAWLVIGLLLGRAKAWTLVQNEHDARMLASKSRNPITRIGGAGVDPEHYAALPPPEGAHVRAAVVSRMLWSKGIDTVVAAQRLLRQRGVTLDVTLAGPVERDIPNALPQATLEAWAKEPGIRWIGREADVRKVWRDADIAVLASRGGEGLPRALLEAASCGRPIVTTDVPGCRDLVRPGTEGLIVPPDDAEALATALATLAADAGLRRRMGEAARARVLEGYTEAQVSGAVVDLYKRISR